MEELLVKEEVKAKFMNGEFDTYTFIDNGGSFDDLTKEELIIAVLNGEILDYKDRVKNCCGECNRDYYSTAVAELEDELEKYTK